MAGSRDATKEKPAPADDGARDRTKVGGRPAEKEIGGPKGPEPTRYGDWEKGGRCSDF
ncbi:MAG TPA: DUF1674 domain-containing protein [Geminicoccaceae bacterium]